MAKTENIITQCDDFAEISPEQCRGTRIIPRRVMAVKYDGLRGTPVVFDVITGKQRGNRVMPVTAYLNDAAVIRAVIQGNKALVLGPEIDQGRNIEADVRQA